MKNHPTAANTAVPPTAAKLTAATTPAHGATPPVTTEGQTSQRADRRTPLRVPCRVRLVDAQTGEVRTVVGETVNLSAGGVALQVGLDVPLGTWIETLIPHPQGDPLFLCGRVQHVRRTMAANFELGVVLAEDGPHGFM